MKTYLEQLSEHGREIDFRAFFLQLDVREQMYACLELTGGEPSNALQPTQMGDEKSLTYKLLNDVQDDLSINLTAKRLTEECKDNMEIEGAVKHISQQKLTECLPLIKVIFVVLMNFHRDRKQMQADFSRRLPTESLQGLWSIAVDIILRFDEEPDQVKSELVKKASHLAQIKLETSSIDLLSQTQSFLEDVDVSSEDLARCLE